MGQTLFPLEVVGIIIKIKKVHKSPVNCLAGHRSPFSSNSYFIYMRYKRLKGDLTPNYK